MNNDKEIVDAVRARRAGWPNLLVNRFGQEVFTMIVRITDDVMDAEELTQDTFLRAFQRIGSYDPRRASVGTWLCRIAHHLTIDFLRWKPPVLLPIDESEGWQTDITDDELDGGLSTGAEERIQQLEALMDRLAPDERLLLTLHYYENRSLDECAFIMDSTPHALANRLYRIRKKLYKQLQDVE